MDSRQQSPEKQVKGSRLTVTNHVAMRQRFMSFVDQSTKYAKNTNYAQHYEKVRRIYLD